MLAVLGFCLTACSNKDDDEVKLANLTITVSGGADLADFEVVVFGDYGLGELFIINEVKVAAAPEEQFRNTMMAFYGDLRILAACPD